MPRPFSRPFAQVDVFTAVPYTGNPLAVVGDAEGLTTDQMRRSVGVGYRSKGTSTSATVASQRRSTVSTV